MSASPSFSVSPEVTQEWQSAIKPAKPYRALQLQFKGETLHLMKEQVSEGEACYILFRIEDSNHWSLISYVPEDNISKTQEKMLYAVAKSSLKTRFGIGYFSEDWHVNNKKQLTYINYKNETSQKAEVALSESERVVLNGIKEEEQERQRQMAVPNPTRKTALNQVETTFNSDISRELQRFKEGQINFVRIGIDGSENACLEDSRRVNSLDEAKSSLAPGVPGYYIFSHRTGASPSNLFIYYCPDKSPHNTRLVYATRMKGIREKIQRGHSINISKTIEIQDAKDFESQVNNRPTYESPSGFKEHRAAASPKIDKPHPLFGGNGGAPKKKVVMPPPAAYQ